MRLIFLLQDTGALYGAESATLALARGLKSRGDDIRFVLIHETRLGYSKTPLRRALLEAGWSCDELAVAHPFSMTLIDGLQRLSKTYRPDLVYAVGYKACVHGYLASRRGEAFRLASTVHGWLERLDLKERFYEAVEKWVLKRLPRVVVLTEFYRDRLVAQGFREERLAVIPTGIDADAIVTEETARTTFEKEAPITVGILGRLSWEKNHTLFLRMAELLRRKVGDDVRFLIAGEGTERSRIEGAIKALNMSQNVEVAGFMDRNAFMERVRVVCVCSRIENLPLSVLEAMAWCRPVVATAVGGLPEMIRDGVTGFLSPPDQPEGLVDRIAVLVRDPAAAWQMGCRARADLQTRFNLSSMIRRYAECFEAVCRSKAE